MPRYTYLKDFRPNKKGVRAIAVGRQAQAAVRQVAVRAKAVAEVQAPKRTGAYVRRFGVSTHINTEFGDTRYVRAHACADLFNSDPGARWIEAGYAAWTNNDGEQGGFHVLRRTAQEMAAKHAASPR